MCIGGGQRIAAVFEAPWFFDRFQQEVAGSGCDLTVFVVRGVGCPLPDSECPVRHPCCLFLVESLMRLDESPQGVADGPVVQLVDVVQVNHVHDQ